MLEEVCIYMYPYSICVSERVAHKKVLDLFSLFLFLSNWFVLNQGFLSQNVMAFVQFLANTEKPPPHKPDETTFAQLQTSYPLNQISFP